MEKENSLQMRVVEAVPVPFRLSIAIPLHNEEAVIPELRFGSGIG
jgi:hypothetical protein